MKTLALLLIAVTALILGLSSCATRQPVSRQVSANNKDYTVSYLFEHEGCKVYRFYDNGNYVYFTNSAGTVTSISTDSTRTRVQTIVNRK